MEQKKALLKSLYEIVFELDMDYRFTEVITKNEALLFVPRAELLGKTVSDVYDQELAECFTSAFQMAAQSGKKQFVEYASRIPGDERFFLAEVNYLMENVKSSHFTVGVSDYTYQKQAEIKLQQEKEIYERIFRHVPIGILQFDNQGTLVNCNEQFAQIIGTKKERLIGYNAFTIADPEFRAAAERAIGGEAVEIEKAYHSILGNKKTYLRAVYEPQYNEKGQVNGGIGIVEDITVRKKMERKIELEKDQFKTTLFSIGDGVIATDIYNRITLLNRAAEKITGWSLEEASGHYSEEILRMINEGTGEYSESPVLRVLETGACVNLTNHTLLIAKSGREIPIEDSACPIKDDAGKTIGVVVVFRDMTVSRAKEAEIEYLSFHDHMTGLYNRRFFEAELERLDTVRNLPLALIVSDVNGLKLTNDAFGHQVGDKLLKTVADTMKRVCRDEDIISRVGGDEFVILLPKTDKARVKQIVKQIADNLAAQTIETGSVSISSGWEIKTRPDQDINDVFKAAEKKMYRHKVTERNSTRNEAILFIVKTLYEKFPREQEHAENVGELSGMAGKTIGLTDEEVNELIMAGNLHDIGKIAISCDVLNKDGYLNADDWCEIERHPEVSYSILSTISNYASLATIILSHHERYDGTGYPKGLKGREIPYQSRIIAIADAYDAMTHGRPYKEAISRDEAIAALRQGANAQFDPDLVEMFIKGLMD